MATISITNNIITAVIAKVQDLALESGKAVRLSSSDDLMIVNIDNSIYIVGDGSNIANPNHNLEKDYKKVPSFFVGIC